MTCIDSRISFLQLVALGFKFSVLPPG